MRRCLFVSIAVWVSLVPLFAGAAEKDFSAVVQPYLKNHCLRCHSAEDDEGDFRLDQLSTEVGTKDTALWAEVRERISSGEMPPEDVPSPPTAEQSAAIVQWLSNRIAEGESARMAMTRQVSFHRLTREEYVHTIYDLLGVHFDATDPGAFTGDPEWQGFNRIGSVLSLSASHIEKYFAAAETILDEAYPAKPPERVTIKRPAQPVNTISEPHRTRLTEAGLIDKVRYDLWPQDQHRYSKPDRLPAPGVYEARFKLSGLKPADGRAPRLLVYHDKLDRVLFQQDVVAPEDKPTIVSFRTHLPDGYASVIVTNDVPGPSNLPRSGRHGRKPFLSLKDGRIPWQLKLTDEEGEPLYPFLILDWAEWEGPIITPQEQQKRDTFLSESGQKPEDARQGLAEFARRAFRRPVTDAEVDRYLNLVSQEMELGADYRSAVKTAMLGILCSKSFLFLVEGDAGASGDQPDETDQPVPPVRLRLNDWELASRLSYMLWSTMPDEELFDLAQQGSLSGRDVLRQQVDRMLDDPRAERFKASFPKQWLHLSKVGMFAPDKNLYPDYDNHLEQSMIGETLAFFRHVVDENLTLREFIDSDWTMINPRLAMHYQMQCEGEDRFQRVTLQPQNHRGGLLTQAAILSLTSDGTRHRPVHRGVWLSESIFGKTPPPPPANVEPIEPNPVDSPKATLRMKLEAHREHASCAACHRHIDPLGLAFENYDAIGKWRDREIVRQGRGENPKVDPSGVLPDGRKFADAKEFKQLLMDDLDQFNHTFIKKLATYALRRPMTFEDEDEIAEIAAVSNENDYRVRDILSAMILSDLFRQR